MLIVKALRIAKGVISTGFSPLAPIVQPVQTVDMDKPTNILVVDDDPALRQNRLALLNQLHGLMNQVADISRLAQ